MSAFNIILISLLLMQACASSDKNISKDQTSADSVTETREDTIPKPTPPPVSKLGPTEAKISGHVTTVDSSKIFVHVMQILEYGSSSIPPIAVNDTLAIRAKSNEYQNFQQDSEVVLIIRHNITTDNLQTPRWSLVKKSEN